MQAKKPCAGSGADKDVAEFNCTSAVAPAPVDVKVTSS